MRGQNGTAGYDTLHGSVVLADGSIVLCGESDEVWWGAHHGEADFVAVALNSSDGTELWRWQVMWKLVSELEARISFDRRC